MERGPKPAKAKVEARQPAGRKPLAASEARVRELELRLAEDVIRADLGRVLLKLEALQEESVRKTLEPKPAEIQMAEADQTAALELLRSPDLLSRLLDDFEVCGVVVWLMA